MATTAEGSGERLRLTQPTLPNRRGGHYQLHSRITEATKRVRETIADPSQLPPEEEGDGIEVAWGGCDVLPQSDQPLLAEQIDGRWAIWQR